jgi:hypothetical protein
MIRNATIIDTGNITAPYEYMRAYASSQQEWQNKFTQFGLVQVVI